MNSDCTCKFNKNTMPLLDGITADLEKFVQGREDNRDVKRKGDVEKEWLCQDSQPSKREVNKSWHV